MTISARSDSDKDRRDRDCRDSEHHERNLRTPVKLVGAINVPTAQPSSFLRFDISWVDQAREKYYLADAGNTSVDVFDAENDLYLGRIAPGFHGLGDPQRELCTGPHRGCGQTESW
jgi:hypothetical protein